METFLKMHGLGNDFAVFDGRKTALSLDSGHIRRLADRRRGIGCDQLIVIEPSRLGDAFMRIYNADGAEVEQCGNAARCIARLLMDEAGEKTRLLDTTGGMLVCSDAGGGLVTVDMGAPKFDWREIPMAQAVDQVFALPLPGVDYPPLAEVTAVSMGNPHAVMFVSDVDHAPVETLGPRIEHHPWFPARTNVEFVEKTGPRDLRMRVWERGVGVTRACGTGACAVAVAAHVRGFTARVVDVVLDGGTLRIDWRESDDHVLMTGPTTLSYKGEIDLASLAP